MRRAIMKLLLISFFVMGMLSLSMLISPSFAVTTTIVEVRVDESFDKSSYNIGDAGVVTITITSNEDLEIYWVSISLVFVKENGAFLEDWFQSDYREDPAPVLADSATHLALEFEIPSDTGIISGPLVYRIGLNFAREGKTERFETYQSLKISSSTVENTALPSYSDHVDALEDVIENLQEDYEDLQTDYSDLDNWLTFVTNLLYILSVIAATLVILTIYFWARKRT